MPGVWIYSGFLQSSIREERTRIIFLGIGLYVPRCLAFGPFHPYGVAVDHFLTWSKVPSSGIVWITKETESCIFATWWCSSLLQFLRLACLSFFHKSNLPNKRWRGRGWSSIDSFRGSSFNSGLLLKSSREACKRCFVERWPVEKRVWTEEEDLKRWRRSIFGIIFVHYYIEL